MLNRKSIKTDLCVIGGGMAGICAAISSARNGAKVVLMHERPVLGGNASSEIRMWVCGAHGRDNRETGILEEINLENLYRNPTKNYYIWDSVLYDFVIREENITLLLNCTCMDAKTETGDFKDGRNIKIASVTGYQMTSQTFYDVEAKYYADCSGDSILAPLTGAKFRIGRESAEEYGERTSVNEADSMTMGMSCLIQGRETEREIKFTPPEWSTKLTKEHFEHREPDLNNTYENFWYLELGGNRHSIHDTDEIQKELIPLAIGTWDYIKNSGGFDAKKWELEFLGFLPGKRESRRMTGEYIVTQKDISEGKIFEDTVAYGGWPLDDHFPMGFYHRGVPNTDFKTPAPYCLPYRALYSENVENLYFAGRNISMTHMAMSSIRVMATCALLGQAVGTAAAIASKYNLTPNGVYKEKLSLLQETLMNDDCFLPNKTRKTCDCFASTNTAESIRNGQDRAHRLYNTEKCGMTVKNNTSVYYDVGGYVKSVHIVFDSDLNRETLPGDECERLHATRCNIRLDSPVMTMPKTLCKNFTLEIETKNGKIIKCVEYNRKRAYHIEVNDTVKEIRLAPSENWGNTDETAIFSFDFM